MSNEMKLSDIDIADPDLYAVGAPLDRYARLRREAPVFWHDEPGGPGFWAITKHADVVTVSKDWTTFSSLLGGIFIPDLPKDDGRASPDNLAVMDPPRHTQYRNLIGKSFTPNVISQMEPFIHERVSALLEPLIERGRFDFMEDFAMRLPMAIILRMVGVPAEDEAQLTEWIIKILTVDEDFKVSDEEKAATTERFMAYAHDLAASRRGNPKDDLLSGLMAAEVDGVKLSYREFGMFFMLLLAAGTFTTRIVLGNGVLALIEHPDQRAKLIERAELFPSAVEEILRYCPPIVHFRRTATRDTELRGQKILAGQKVVVWYVSANRDEDVFANPDVFDIERKPNDHVAFGHGPHFCLGNALARLTMRVAIGQCLERMPNLEIGGQIERLRTNNFNGIRRMPVLVQR